MVLNQSLGGDYVMTTMDERKTISKVMSDEWGFFRGWNSCFRMHACSKYADGWSRCRGKGSFASKRGGQVVLSTRSTAWGAQTQPALSERPVIGCPNLISSISVSIGPSQAFITCAPFSIVPGLCINLCHGTYGNRKIQFKQPSILVHINIPKAHNIHKRAHISHRAPPAKDAIPTIPGL